MKKILWCMTFALCTSTLAQSVSFDKQIKLKSGITQFTDKNCNNLIAMLYQNFSSLGIGNTSCYTNSGKVGTFISSMDSSLQSAGYRKASDEVVGSGYLKQTWNNTKNTVAVLYGLNSSTMVLGSAIKSSSSNNPTASSDTNSVADTTPAKLSSSAMAKLIPPGMVYMSARDLVFATRNNGSVEVTAVLENSRNTVDSAKGDYTIYINNRMAHVTLGSNNVLVERFTPTGAGDLAARPQPERMTLNGPVVIIGDRLMIPNDLVKFFGCSFSAQNGSGRVTCTDTTIFDDPFSVTVPVQRF